MSVPGVSFSVENLDTLVVTDMSDYGIYVLPGGNWPIIPEPLTETVNVPGMDGGYTYVNDAKPGMAVLKCILVCEDDGDNGDSLYDELVAAFAIMPTDQRVNIYLDFAPNWYWVGVRISGVSSIPAGTTCIEFDLVFALDDPTPTRVGGS